MSDKTILNVEDNEFNRKIVRQLLAKTTYRLREAVDGEAGMASARDPKASFHQQRAARGARELTANSR